MIYEVFIYDEDNHNVKSIKTPDIEGYKDLPNVAIDPDLKEVKGYNREHWKIIDGKVIPKTREERIESDAFHDARLRPPPVVLKVPVEKIVEVPVEKIVEVIKEVPVEKIVEKTVEVQVPFEIQKLIPVPFIPKWVWIIPIVTFCLGIATRLL